MNSTASFPTGARRVCRLRSSGSRTPFPPPQAFGDDKLSKEERFERDYLVAQAAGQLFWHETADQPHINPAYYAGNLDPSTYVVVPYAPPEVRIKAYTKYLQAIPRAAEQIRANIKAPMPLSFVDYAKSAFGGYAEYYPGDGLAAFKGVGTAADQDALKTASTAAATAMKGLADWAEGAAGNRRNRVRTWRGQVPADARGHRDGFDAAGRTPEDRRGRPQVQPGSAARRLQPLGAGHDHS